MTRYFGTVGSTGTLIGVVPARCRRLGVCCCGARGQSGVARATAGVVGLPGCPVCTRQSQRCCAGTRQGGRPRPAPRRGTRGVRPRGRGQREESGHQGTGRVLSMAAEISLLFLPLHPFCLRPACTCTPCRPSPGFHWLTAPSHSLRPLGSRHGTVLSYASAVSP